MQWARHVAGMQMRGIRNSYHVSVRKPEGQGKGKVISVTGRGGP
jgi:hypothetical protein